MPAATYTVPIYPFISCSKSSHLSVQENAVVLLSRQHKDEEWRSKFEPYLRSLPSPNTTLLCKELMTPADKAMLQDDGLVSTLIFQQSF